VSPAHPYLAQQVRAAVAHETAELGVEVVDRGERLVLQGQCDQEVCAAVLRAARRAAGGVEVVDELEHLGAAPPSGRAERIQP
jgi:hypothetical protein